MVPGCERKDENLQIMQRKMHLRAEPTCFLQYLVGWVTFWKTLEYLISNLFPQSSKEALKKNTF